MRPRRHDVGEGSRGFVSGPVGLLAGGEEKDTWADEAEGLVMGRRATEGVKAVEDHWNLLPMPPSPSVSPAKNSSVPGASPRSKPVPSSAPSVAPSKVTAEEEQASASVDDATAVKERPVFRAQDLPCTDAIGDRSFAVNGFLDDRASQADAFDLVGVPMIDSALAGFNASLVCYGHSGTGKTYTMWRALAAMVDSNSDHADRGIVPRVFQNLFAQIQGWQETSPDSQTSYQCQCSFLEVYNEKINDLLDPSQRNHQKIRCQCASIAVSAELYPSCVCLRRNIDLQKAVPDSMFFCCVLLSKVKRNVRMLLWLRF
ncbi:hypothetical protein ABZP36_014961 [Zizania latifolia]